MVCSGVDMLYTAEDLRAFEEQVRDIYLQGKIRAPVHLSRGNEKPLIEIFRSIGPEDWVFSTYRSHYHALLKNVPQYQVMAEILAGHSIHLTFPQYRFYTSAIVAGILPIALGAALGIKRRGGTEKVWCFVGDMAALTGAFQECLMYAQSFDLPITFMVECNGWSTNSPTHQVWGISHTHVPFFVGRESKFWKYCYDREGWPHYGVGVRVPFDETRPGFISREERSDVMG